MYIFITHIGIGQKNNTNLFIFWCVCVCVETRVSTLALRGTQKCIYANKRARSPCRQWFMELGLTNRPYKLLLNWVVALITIFVSEMLRTTDFPHAVRAHIRAYGRSACLCICVSHCMCIFFGVPKRISIHTNAYYPPVAVAHTLAYLYVARLGGSVREGNHRAAVFLKSKWTSSAWAKWVYPSLGGRWCEMKPNFVRDERRFIYTQSVYFANTIQQNAFAQHRGGSYHDTDDWSKIILARQEPARYEKMVC